MQTSESWPCGDEFTKRLRFAESISMGHETAGSTAALHEFERIVHENHPRIYRAACLLLDDVTDAEDLTQIVFVQAWRGWRSFEGRSQPYTWLYRILLRTYRREARRRWWWKWLRADGTSEAEELIERVADVRPGPDVIQSRRDDVLELRAVIRGISPKLREVLVLRYTEDWSLKQIAETLRVPEGTVKSRLHLAQRIVAARLRSRGWT